MEFSTPIFLFYFLPIITVLYFLLPFQTYVLIIGSIIFYLFGDPIFSVVLIALIYLNYYFASKISYYSDINKSLSKTYFVSGTIFNIFILAYFKYTNFIIHILNNFFSVLNIQTINYHLKIAVPLALSFFTFRIISYLSDIYQKKCRLEIKISKYALFCLYFPYLIAGPLVAYKDFESNRKKEPFAWELFAPSIERIIIGLSKKLIIADTLSNSVDLIFSSQITNISASVAWIGAIFYTLQIYFDFSGYTDMAIGISGIFGYQLPENFNFPYISKSIREFWQRWHITLSKWLRDYIYIPIGGNRVNKKRLYFNIIIVFLICGIWHGANITFVFWGLLHGLFISIERSTIGQKMNQLPNILKHTYALSVIILGWVVFRSPNVEFAYQYILAMFGSNGWSSDFYNTRIYVDSLGFIVAIIGIFACHPFINSLRINSVSLNNSTNDAKKLYVMRFISYVMLIIISFSIMANHTHQSFVYFKF